MVFLLKILLHDIKSVSVNKTSVPKITSQPRNFATNSIQPSEHFSGQNCPTFSACKIVNFCPSHLTFWNCAFQTIYFSTVQKQIWLHIRHFKFICVISSKRPTILPVSSCENTRICRKAREPLRLKFGYVVAWSS